MLFRSAALTQQISEADAVVLTAAPVGSGNLDNLRVLAEETQVPVLFVSENGTAAVPDFTGGKATAYLDRMAASGRLTLVTGSDLISRCTAKGEISR